MDDFPRWEPPLFGSEQAHLFAMLDRLRVTFRYKCDGLNIEQLAARIPTSGLSLGGLLQHLSAVEDEKFTYLIAGQRPEVLLALTENGQDPFAVDAKQGADQLYQRYDQTVAASRIIQDRCLESDTLDTESGLEFNGQVSSVRRIICDLIEEYGRHTGHADLLREAIDSRVGEDPPWDYLPSWFTA